jgi:phosphoglycerol transferase MdoB-like AlkP superfamily enzyme
MPKNQKTFTFCLTINTHLPFSLPIEETMRPEYLNLKGKLNSLFPTEQTFQRYYRMKQELNYLAALIKNSEADRILIIGDHAPPFLFKEERKLYLPNLVPALFIERK